MGVNGGYDGKCKIYISFTMSISPSGKRETTQLGVRLRNDIVERLRDVCEKERRPLNYQLEIILEEWFAARAKPPSKKIYLPGEYPTDPDDITDDTVVWPDKKHRDQAGQQKPAPKEEKHGGSSPPPRTLDMNPVGRS